MKILDILPQENIIADLQGTSKLAVLEELASVLAEHNPAIAKQRLVDVLLEREKLGSTAIGEGIAIPHGKLPKLSGVVAAFGRSRSGVDFQSLDGGTRLLFPILAWALEKCRTEGIHVLANIGRYLDESGFVETASFRQKLPAWTFFYRTTEPALAERLKQPSAWSPSLYDSDASL